MKGARWVVICVFFAGCGSSTTAPGEDGGSGAEPLRSIAIVEGPTAVEQGEPASYRGEARDAEGNLVTGASIQWSVAPTGSGFVNSEGDLVAYSIGTFSLIAAWEGASDTLEIQSTERSVPSGRFEVLAPGSLITRHTSDLWVHGNVVYTGTIGERDGTVGNAMFVWDVSDPTAPTLVDSVVVDAGTVNDVKIRADGALAAITHEGGSVGGVTLLDLTDPLHPEAIRFFGAGMEPGVHNVWLEGDLLFAAVDGNGSGLRIVDVTDTASPSLIASRSYASDTFLHDVYVREGMAFLSYWGEGLVIVDVGNGIVGGSPADPRVVSRTAIPNFDVHNAWYWPDAGHVFLGDEIDVTSGQVQVVDVRDLKNPELVASYRVAGENPHNFWVDETRGILYMAYYGNGLRALDVTGDLLGELNRQNRDIGHIQYDNGSGCFPVSGAGTCTWAPQLHDGHIYLSDMNSGLWVMDLRLE